MKLRPQKTADELISAVKSFIAASDGPQDGIESVRFIASPLTTNLPDECNWRLVVTTPATTEQLEVVQKAVAEVQRDWDMLERRRTPRLPPAS